RPRSAAISGRVLLLVVPRSPRVVPPALVPVAARVLPVARAVPARAELVGPRPAARVVSPTADRAVRSARVLVVLPVRRRPERPLVDRVRLAPAVTAATPTVASRSPRLSPCPSATAEQAERRVTTRAAQRLAAPPGRVPAGPRVRRRRPAPGSVLVV